jgi:hypothetical protein
MVKFHIDKKAAILFWVGAGVYSVINLVMNANGIPQTKVLNYNYIITGAAIVGIIINSMRK